MKAPLLFTCTVLLCSLLQAQVNVTQVKDINPGNGNSNPNSLVVSGGKLFFIAYNGTTNQLGVTEGTEATTLLLGPAGAQNVSTPTAYKNKVYFTCNDNTHGQELWVSDGTAAGTKLFADLYAGTTGSYPVYLTVANNLLFFAAYNTDGGRSLYASDGTAAGTVVLKAGFNDNFNGVPTFVILNNTILFKASDGNANDGLWISDGTAAGTQPLVKGLSPSDPAGASVALNNKVYFTADDNAHGLELWASDGTTAGTYMVKNISPDDAAHGVYGNSSPQAFCAYNGKVYFSATDGTHGQELWVTDGTEANTHMVKDVLPGTSGSLPYHSLVYNNKLYFITWEQQQLWVSDGTEAGTVEVAPLHEYSQFAAIWNGLMYFESPSQTEVLQSDGTTAGTAPAKAANTTSSINYSASDYHFTEYNGDLYFSGYIYGISKGFELVKLTKGALPLTLLSFTGSQQKDDDVLEWQTASEINTAYFEVQQSVNGTSFTPAGTVAAAGNSSTVKNYSFQQKSAVNPTGYYRLKMADKSGIFTYSRIIRLPRGNAAGLTAFYNNAGRQITIQNHTGGVCTWQLYNAAGSLVKKGISADGTITIATGGTAGGVYMLSCTSNAGSSRFTLPVF